METYADSDSGEEVQRGGNFQVFEELFAADFIDHSNQRLSEEF